MQVVGRMRVYEALLSQPESLAQAQAARRRIERLGGRIEAQTSGAVRIVTLWLPDPYTPADVLPALPFYPA